MTYLVIGLYKDDDTRFAQSVEAECSEDAEERIHKEFPLVTIAGVLNDKMQVVA